MPFLIEFNFCFSFSGSTTARLPPMITDHQPFALDSLSFRAYYIWSTKGFTRDISRNYKIEIKMYSLDFQPFLSLSRIECLNSSAAVFEAVIIKEINQSTLSLDFYHTFTFTGGIYMKVYAAPASSRARVK